MSLLTSRASHLSAGIASHALLTIMFKDVALLFWLIPFYRILINSLNYLGKRQESLIQTLWKQFFFKKYCHKQHMNLQQNKFQILSWWYFTLFCKSYQQPPGMTWILSQKTWATKHMFRYTSGISQILLKTHLEFLPIQSNSNVVQTNNQNVGEAQI